MDRLQATVMIPGEAAAPVLRLGKPISFWGGVDPYSGRITDPRHPDHDANVGGRVLVLPGTIGSSSSSAVMLELLAGGNAPAALILAETDAILTLGIIVGREMGYGSIPVLLLPQAAQGPLGTGRQARIDAAGAIALA